MRPIDADALKEWAEEYHASNWGIPQDELIYAIGSAPTIEPKRGKREQHIGIGNVALIKCSECGFIYPELLGVPIFNFCPNCGAKMERSEDE